MSNYKGPYNSFSQNAEPIYNQSNILGTVSQSGGVPTGAIIERGSNANGEFVRYADGTLISTALSFQPNWGIVSYQLVPLPRNLIGRGTAFVTSLSVSNSDLDMLADAVLDSTSSGSIRIAFRGELDGSSTGQVNVTAIGRWY